MSDGERAARRDDRAIAWLVQPTGAPAEPGRFTPDLYPTGPPLVPAADPGPRGCREVDEATFVRFLEVHLGGNRARIDGAVDRFREPHVIARLPDAGVRAGFLALTGTLGDVLIEPFLGGTLSVSGFVFGRPATSGRVIGPGTRTDPDPDADAGVGARSSESPGVDAGVDAGWRVVNERYRFEPFPLLAGSLLHALLHHEPGVSDAEETVTHAVAAAVHLQLISRSPDLVGPTELARRQSSLALSLLCSRQPGEAEVRIVAPDGLGTVPGGARLLRTADFWSIPFAVDAGVLCRPTGAMRLLVDTLLASLTEEVPEDDRPYLVDRELAELLDTHVLSRELRPHELLAAAAALTLTAPDTA